MSRNKKNNLMKATLNHTNAYLPRIWNKEENEYVKNIGISNNRKSSYGKRTDRKVRRGETRRRNAKYARAGSNKYDRSGERRNNPEVRKEKSKPCMDESCEM